MKDLLCQAANYYEIPDQEIGKYRVYIKEHLVLGTFHIPIDGISDEIRFELIQGKLDVVVIPKIKLILLLVIQAILESQ